MKSVDRLAQRLTVRYGAQLACREGCSACCGHHLSVFEVEAAAVRDAVGALPESLREVLSQQAADAMERTARGEPCACPLLVEDRCSIYATRPVICRTQGLPLLTEAEDGSQEVDFCPLNFTAQGDTDVLQEDHLVPLEEINMTLARANLEHCVRVRFQENAAARTLIGEIILQADR